MNVVMDAQQLSTMWTPADKATISTIYGHGYQTLPKRTHEWKLAALFRPIEPILSTPTQQKSNNAAGMNNVHYPIIEALCV